jgi:hypothetical protein
MTTFTYTGPDGHTYPALQVSEGVFVARVLSGGDTVEVEVNPDPARFTEAKAAKAKTPVVPL